MSHGKSMIDGKAALLAYVNRLHPRAEISLTELQPGGSCELPPGFSVTNNPHNLAIANPNPWASVLFGPTGDTGVLLNVRSGSRGPWVSGLDLVASIMTLLRVGPPVWDRNPNAMYVYCCEQLSQCAPFTAEPLIQTREQMEVHASTCPQCQPVFEVLKAAVNLGSGRTKDADLRELIERAHEDPDRAREFYEGVRAAQPGAMLTEKPQRPARRAQEVTA